MTEDALERLKYPVGRVDIPEVVPPEQFDHLIRTLETFPAKLRAATEHLDAGATRHAVSARRMDHPPGRASLP